MALTEQEKDILLKAIERAEETKATLEAMVINITNEINDLKEKVKG